VTTGESLVLYVFAVVFVIRSVGICRGEEPSLLLCTSYLLVVGRSTKKELATVENSRK
jgi:hypothetical protein